MRHSCVPDKVLKFARPKLLSIVADDARSRIVLFAKSTTTSRSSWGIQRRFRVPQVAFLRR